MREPAQRLLKTIRKQELLSPGDRVAVAVSGGADSVALLFLLEELRAELGIVLSVAHVNHQLRGAESDEDERFVSSLAARLGLEFAAAAAPIDGSSQAGGACVKSGVEAAARKLRYNFFRELAERGRVNKIATAHTRDDQAETVLLRIFRGTGIRGLAGVHPRLPLSSAAEVVRPLLGFRRAEVRDYLRARNETWREDSSNADPTFLRNRIRQRLLPLIAEEFGDASIEHMAELAEIARAEEEYCAGAGDLSGPEPHDPTLNVPALDIKDLLAHPLAIQRRRVRAWIEANAPDVGISFSLVEEILELACGPAGKKLALPGDPRNRTRNVRRTRSEFAFECSQNGADHYEYALPVPGAVEVPELGARIEARIVEVSAVPEHERNSLLDPALVGDTLTIRNWRAGDRYWPAHTAKEKKVKELLADLHATGSKKKLWPVAVNKEGRPIWMRGFATPASFQPQTTKAIWIREIGSKP